MVPEVAFDGAGPCHDGQVAIADGEITDADIGAGADANAWIDLIAEPFSLLVGRDLADAAKKAVAALPGGAS